MPIAAIARKSRSLQAINGADCARANLSDELLETGPVHKSGPRAPQIVIYSLDRRKPCCSRCFDQCILTTLALGVFHHLRNRRLAHVNDSAAIQVLRRDLRVHLCFPPRLPFPRPFRQGLPTTDRPTPAEARRGPAQMAGLSDPVGGLRGAARARHTRLIVVASGTSFFDERPKKLCALRFVSSSASTVRSSSSASIETTGDPFVIDAQAEAEHIQAGSSLDNPVRT